MNHEEAVNFGVGMENGGLGAGDPAFRCGLSFGGNERPIRDAGLSMALPARMFGGTLIEVAWSRPVSWRKGIRFLKQ
jgi:hypothetical protein